METPVTKKGIFAMQNEWWNIKSNGVLASPISLKEA